MRHVKVKPALTELVFLAKKKKLDRQFLVVTDIVDIFTAT